MIRVSLSMSLALALAACESQSSFGMAEAMQMSLAGSYPFEMAGHSTDYAQVWYGRGTSRGNSSEFQFTINPGQIVCQGKGATQPDDFNSYRNQVRCSDGRTADFVIRRPYVMAKIWSGEGVFSDGTPFTWEESSAVGTLEARAATFRQTQSQQQAAAGKGETMPVKGAIEPPQPPRPQTPPTITFPRAPVRPDDIAVIIGNADYGKLGKDIPNVPPARFDADLMQTYVTRVLGVRDGNLIVIKDATVAQMIRVFGSERDPRGQLFDWVKPGKSRVFVYYSGHGAPGAQGDSPFLVPVDADGARIELNGYPLRQLYDNLGKLPVSEVTVVLEACFSGLSPAGSVLGKASPVYIEVKSPPVPANLTVISAGAANQMASWEPDSSLGLFTRHFLEGMAGKADANKDGTVGLDELDRHLKETLTYWARRHYGRDQQAQIIKGGAR